MTLTVAGPQLTGIRIVRAGPQDARDLVPIFEAYRDFYGMPGGGTQHRSMRFLGERLLRDESVIFLARTATGPAGFVQLYPTFSSLRLRPAWIVADLFVEPAQRRRGIAAALMQRVLRHARKTRAALLELFTGIDNEPARTLYESMGFRLDEKFLHYELTIDT